MNPERLFSLCNTLALAGWLILIFAGRRRWAAPLVTGVVLPLLFGIIYSTLLIMHFGETKGGFGTLAGVAALFSNPWLLLAGWIHYLAFDLFVGSWQVRDSQAQGIPHLVVIPCLALTFFFGPAGLLVYFAARAATKRAILIGTLAL